MESKALLTKRRIEKLASEYEGLGLPSSPKDGRFDVFVSHSTADKEFIKNVLLFLYHAKGGIQGYVDRQDSNMLHPTNAETAIALKERIRRAKKLIYVVTNDSLKSVWCNWELGFADRDKGLGNIKLLAIKPNNGKWNHNEYLQQYPYIVYDKSYFRVIMPDGSSMYLYQWLTKK